MVGEGDIGTMTRADTSWVRASISPDREAFPQALAAQGLECKSEGDGRYRVRLPEAAGDADLVFASAAEAAVAVTGLETVRPSLEDWFLTLIENSSPRLD